jgi:GDP-4-dehydro-6-deoxy-D-mannose reductase
MKAFITGASGFVGKHLEAFLVAQGDQVKVSDSKDFDIRDFAKIKEALDVAQPDVIYHLAGLAFVPECESNFAHALDINVNGTENVLKAVREIGSKAVTVLISSGDAYGKVNQAKLPSKESDELNPVNNYSLTKVFAEKLGVRAREIFDQKVVIARPFNHIGPGQSTRFVVSSFAQQLSQMKKRQIEPILRVGNLSAKRDLTDVRDIVRGYRLAAEKGQGIYNFCSSKPVTIESVLKILVEISGVEVKIEIDPARLRPTDNPETRGSFEKARKELGWSPEIPLETTLKDCLAFFD